MVPLLTLMQGGAYAVPIVAPPNLISTVASLVWSSSAVRSQPLIRVGPPPPVPVAPVVVVPEPVADDVDDVVASEPPSPMLPVVLVVVVSLPQAASEAPVAATAKIPRRMVRCMAVPFVDVAP